MNIIATIFIALSLFVCSFLADSCDDHGNNSDCPAGQHWVHRDVPGTNGENGYSYDVCE